MLSVSPGVDANIHESHPLPSFCSLFLLQLYFSLSLSLPSALVCASDFVERQKQPGGFYFIRSDCWCAVLSS